jgi:hypothetical protein
MNDAHAQWIDAWLAAQQSEQDEEGNCFHAK